MFEGLKLTVQDLYSGLSKCKIILMKAGYKKDTEEDTRKREKVVIEGNLTPLLRRNSGFLCSAFPCFLVEHGMLAQVVVTLWGKNTSLVEGKAHPLTRHAALKLAPNH